MATGAAEQGCASPSRRYVLSCLLFGAALGGPTEMVAFAINQPKIMVVSAPYARFCEARRDSAEYRSQRSPVRVDRVFFVVIRIDQRIEHPRHMLAFEAEQMKEMRIHPIIGVAHRLAPQLIALGRKGDRRRSTQTLGVRPSGARPRDRRSRRRNARFARASDCCVHPCAHAAVRRPSRRIVQGSSRVSR